MVDMSVEEFITALNGCYYITANVTSNEGITYSGSGTSKTANVYNVRLYLGSFSSDKHMPSTLITVDVRYLDCSSRGSLAYMFYNCSNLTTINNINSIATTNLVDIKSMFYGCENLTTINGFSSLWTQNITDISFTFYNCKRLQFNNIYFDARSVKYMDFCFFNCQNLTSIPGLDRLNPISINNAFQGCTGLTSVSLFFLWNFTGTNISSLFRDCTNLETVNFSSDFNFSRIKIAEYLFAGCTKLKTLTNFQNISTSNLTDIMSMFRGCSSLTSLILPSNFGANVSNAAGFLEGCTGLTTLDMKNFSTNNLISVHSMFKNCSGLTFIDLSEFNTTNITTYTDMFLNCNAVKLYGDNWTLNSLKTENSKFVYLHRITTQPTPNYQSVYQRVQCTPINIIAYTRFGELSYSWYVDNVLDDEQTSTTFISSFENTGSKRITCKVTNHENGGEYTITSAQATIQVLTGATIPTITVQPSGSTILPMVDYTMSVTATVTSGTLSYQWYCNNEILTGETSNSITVNNNTPGEYIYKCRIINTLGPTTATKDSDNAVVIVSDVTPVITKQPIGASLLIDSSYELNVIATSITGTLSYQWYCNNEILTGETSNSLQIENNEIGEYRYKCKITNTVGSYITYIFTNDAVMKVLIPENQPNYINVGNNKAYKMCSENKTIKKLYHKNKVYLI